MKHSIKPLLFAALAAPCALLADIDWTAYAKSFDITFPGYTGATTLTNFPVLVRLSSARNKFDYSTCYDGSDLRFSDAEGNLLSHEIDTWNYGGESLVWVKVPLFNASTKITAHYGYTGDQLPAVTASDVWSADYVGVWHMKESGVPLAESSGVSTPIDAAAAAVEFGYAGAIGDAVDMSKVTGGWANQMSAADDDDLDGFTDFTMEMWTRQDKWGDSNNPVLLAKRSTSACSYHWYCKKLGDSTRAACMVLSTNGTSTVDKSENSTPPVLGKWTHQAFVRDTVANHFYSFVNGASSQTTGNSYGTLPIASTDERLSFGSGNRGVPFPGQIDEVRISRVARSADWIKATSDCVTDDDFASYDLGIGIDWTVYSHNFSVAFSGYEGSEMLANFPVLVKVSQDSPSGFSYADCLKPNGGDLRFADDTGNLLASEIDTWNPNGVSLVWVKVPFLTALTKIYAYYGCETVPAVDPASVWANGYVGVWHLGDAGNQTQVDSTTNRLNFLCHNKEVQNVDLAVSDGAVGGAVGFNKKGNNYGGLLLVDSDAKLSGFTDCTIEAWVYPTNNTVGTYILSNVTNSYSGAYNVFLSGGKNPRILTQTEGKVKNGGTGDQFDYPGVLQTEVSINEWNHFAFARTGSTGHIHGYLHGVRDPQTKTSSPGQLIRIPGNTVILGNLGGSLVTWSSSYYIYKTKSFLGNIDEVRVSDVARSDDWVKATHDTVAKADFATYSTVRSITRTTVTIIR